MTTFTHEIFVETINFTWPLVIAGIVGAVLLIAGPSALASGFVRDLGDAGISTMLGLIAVLGVFLASGLVASPSYSAGQARDDAKAQVVRDVIKTYPELKSLYVEGGVSNDFLLGTRSVKPRVEELTWGMLESETPLTTWPERKACVIKTQEIAAGRNGSEVNPHSGYAKWTGSITCR